MLLEESMRMNVKAYESAICSFTKKEIVSASSGSVEGHVSSPHTHFLTHESSTLVNIFCIKLRCVLLQYCVLGQWT